MKIFLAGEEIRSGWSIPVLLPMDQDLQALYPTRDNPPTAERPLLVPTICSYSRIMVSIILNLVIAERAWGTFAGNIMVCPSVM